MLSVGGEHLERESQIPQIASQCVGTSVCKETPGWNPQRCDDFCRWPQSPSDVCVAVMCEFPIQPPVMTPAPSPGTTTTPAPTLAPTPQPTPAPTTAPTPQPTPAAVPAPAPQPTPAPTPAPSPLPTPAPTPAPPIVTTITATTS